MKYADKAQRPSKALLKMLGQAWKQSEEGVLNRLKQGDKESNKKGITYNWNEKHITSRVKK